MRTQNELLKDMIIKARGLDYKIRYTSLWFEFYKNGVRRIRVRRAYNDYTISDAEYDRQMARIK